MIAVFFSALIAVPVGLLIGHTGRGTFLVVTGVNALRALPTLGVLLLGVLLWGLGLIPPTVALMLLGIPPLLAGTYSGVAAVDPAVVDAARAMGMTERQVLLRVEVPNALPLILSGLRTATLQIVATATVAAYASLGGLGRYLIDGIKIREFYIALVGALLVTVLALVLDAVLAGAVWLSQPGTGRFGRKPALPQPLLDDEVALETPTRLRGPPAVAYGRRVTEPAESWPAILTWRAHDVPRMESVRVQLSGKRIKAHGRIVSAATPTAAAFSASYDLVTDETGATKRLSLTLTLAERERQLSIARDEEGMWLVRDHQNQTSRAAFDGALDVDVVFSPFFNALPIRRTDLRAGSSLALPVVLRPAAGPDGRAGDHHLHPDGRRRAAEVAGRRDHRHRRRRRVHPRLPRTGNADLITPPARPAAASSSRHPGSPTVMCMMSGRWKARTGSGRRGRPRPDRPPRCARPDGRGPR